jgi:hypothetical protein
MRYISRVKSGPKNPAGLMDADSSRQMPKRKNGRRSCSEWRDRQLLQRAACLWALKIVHNEDADAAVWRDQIDTPLVRELTGSLRKSGIPAAALAVASYDCGRGSKRGTKGNFTAKGVSSPSKVLPLSRRMVCYWRASAGYKKAVNLLSGLSGLFSWQDSQRAPLMPTQQTTTEISDYEMEIERRKEWNKTRDFFTRLRR